MVQDSGRRTRSSLLIAAASFCFWSVGGAQDPVRLSVIPRTPYIEKGDATQYLNFDFLLESASSEQLRINRIDVSVLDERGRVQLRQYLSRTNGMSPGLFTIPNLDLGAKGTISVFNPFFAFGADIALASLTYEFLFDGEQGRQYRSAITVRPVDYDSKTDLILPLRGPVLVYDGHDFYSHHRRVDVGRLRRQGVKLTDTPVRYAYDLSTVNAEGKPYTGDPTRKENWPSYGTAVVAPGAGRVVSAANDVPDNLLRDGSFVPPPGAPSDDDSRSLGNHVVIDHGNGELSVMAHLKPGSVPVRRGDAVRQGQLIGAIGISGEGGPVETFHVHLHYHLASGLGFDSARALPSYFRDFRRLRGSRTIEVARGRIDTGEIVESRR